MDSFCLVFLHAHRPATHGCTLLLSFLAKRSKKPQARAAAETRNGRDRVPVYILPRRRGGCVPTILHPTGATTTVEQSSFDHVLTWCRTGKSSKTSRSPSSIRAFVAVNRIPAQGVVPVTDIIPTSFAIDSHAPRTCCGYTGSSTCSPPGSCSASAAGDTKSVVIFKPLQQPLKIGTRQRRCPIQFSDEFEINSLDTGQSLEKSFSSPASMRS